MGNSCIFPFSSFLQTDYAPTKEETAPVKEFLQQSEAQFKKNKDDMDRLYAEIDTAELEHMRLQSEIDKAFSILALSRNIPDSILRMIFFRCLPTDGSAVLDSNTAPLVLTRICKHWRQIAVTTPELWSTIHIPIVMEEIDEPEYTPTSPMTMNQAFLRATGRAEMISQWLRRAGETSLSISLFVHREDDHWHSHGERHLVPPLEINDEYIQVVKPFSTRWKHLRLNGPYRAYQDLASLSSAGAPLLESLSLHLEEGYYQPQDHSMQLWLSSGLFASPALRRLRVDDLQFDLTQTGANLKLLTHLSLGCSRDWHGWNPASRLAQVARILKHCTGLIHLRLHLASISYHDEIPAISPVHMPLLRRLVLHHDRSMLPLVEKLRAPSLEEISFESHEPDDGEAVIMRLVAEAKGNLRKLNINTDVVSDSTFRDILRQSPKLTSLALRQTRYRPLPKFEIDDELLALMTSSDGPPLCPLLEEFECEFETAFTYEGFLNFVTRKQSGLEGRVARLRKAFIHVVSETNAISGRMEHRYFHSTFDMKPFTDEGLEFREVVIHEFSHNAPQANIIFSAREGWRAEDEDD